MKLRVPVVLLSTLLVSACTGIGQLAIRDERNGYNDIISETTTQQLLKNVVRAHFREPPSFFDVVEVDQTKTAQASITGGSSNIGAALGLGALSSSLSATDSPILKYQPPSSAGYIQQILFPIPVDSIANLNNSNANITPLLAFSVNALTPAYLAYDRSIDLIDFLDRFGAINTVPLPDGRVAVAKRPRGFLTPGTSPFLRCFERLEQGRLAVPVGVVDDLWAKLTALFDHPGPSSIILRSADTKPDKGAKPPAGSIVLTRAIIYLTQ